MQKIKHELLSRIIESTLTRYQIDFLLCLIQKSDARGQVSGVYYLDIHKEIGCGVSTVYVIVKELEKKGFIKVSKSDSKDMDITILGNDFTDENGNIVYKNYLDINKKIMHDREFKKLGAVEKKAALYLMRRCITGKVWLQTGNVFNILSDLLKSNNTKNRKKDKSNIHISVRAAKACMKVLKKWFNMGVRKNKQKNMDVINILKETASGKPKVQKHKKGKLVQENAYAMFYYHRHFVKTICRRAGIATSPLNLNDTADLIQQYERTAISVGKDIFDLIKAAILNNCGETLKSIAVHKALKESIKQF